MLPRIPIRLLFVIVLAVILGACSSTIFRLKKAAEAPIDKVATILVSNVSLRYIDDRIFDLCGFTASTCGVQVLPGEHRLRYNVFTTQVAREKGRGPNRNSLHNRVSRMKFEQSVELKEGMIYQLSFNESTLEKFEQKKYPMEIIKGEVKKSITFKAYDEKTRRKLLNKLKKSKIITTSEYRPDV